MDIQLPFLIKMIENHLIEALVKSNEKKMKEAVEIYSRLLYFGETIIKMYLLNFLVVIE
jgi:hypothetical protein